MRLAHILRHDVILSLGNILLFANDADALATTGCVGFHNVHILKVARFTVNHPALIIFRENVRGRGNIEGLAVQAAHSLNIAPHQVFSTDSPGASEVIDVLLGVHVPETALFEETSPDHVPSRACYMTEASHFEGIHDTVVCMRAI